MRRFDDWYDELSDNARLTFNSFMILLAVIAMAAVATYAPSPEDTERRLIMSCVSPTFVQAHSSYGSGTKYIYVCADGRMIEVRSLINRAKVRK